MHHLIGISTMSLASNPDLSRASTAEVLGRIELLGYPSLELDFHLDKVQLSGLAQAARAKIVHVLSVHNTGPKYVGNIPPYNTGLADLNPGRRKESLEDAKQTILLACELGVRTVVMPLGRIQTLNGAPIDAAELALRKAFMTHACDSELSRLRAKVVGVRRDRLGVHLDAARHSLDELVPFARRHGVKLHIENRYEFLKLPLENELGELIRHYDGSLGYCFDFGHAGAIHALGLGFENGPCHPGLDVGIFHLNDVNMMTLEDHLPVGHRGGALDQAEMARTIRAAPMAPVIVEIRASHSTESLLETIQMCEGWLASHEERT